MKPITYTVTAALLTTLSLSIPASAENLRHTNQLLSTKQCPNCELQGAGLVMANLAGANLAGANLSQANLSRANLAGADLSGANLAGTSLNGANLTGANLTGASLLGADLRDAYIMNANLTGVTYLETAYLSGVIGMPTYAGTKEQFYYWAMAEAEKGNYIAALEHYNRAIHLDANFAPAYLARALVFYRLGNSAAATQDTQFASQLFSIQENEVGHQAAEDFLSAMEQARNPTPARSGSNFQNILGGIGSLLMKLFF